MVIIVALAMTGSWVNDHFFDGSKEKIKSQGAEITRLNGVISDYRHTNQNLITINSGLEAIHAKVISMVESGYDKNQIAAEIKSMRDGLKDLQLAGAINSSFIPLSNEIRSNMAIHANILRQKTSFSNVTFHIATPNKNQFEFYSQFVKALNQAGFVSEIKTGMIQINGVQKDGRLHDFQLDYEPTKQSDAFDVFCLLRDHGLQNVRAQLNPNTNCSPNDLIIFAIADLRFLTNGVATGR